MPQNEIQFQKGMSLDEFFEHYGTDAKCEQALEEARWVRGYTCPTCGCTAHSTFYRNGKNIGSVVITSTRSQCSQAPFSMQVDYP